MFTLPQEVSQSALRNKKAVYGLLFPASAETLLEIGANPKYLGADTGFLSVLHTWGRNLPHHPHVHCVIPAGGLSLDRLHWVRSRSGFFLPVRVAVHPHENFSRNLSSSMSAIRGHTSA